MQNGTQGLALFLNDSVIKSVTCLHLMAVLVSFQLFKSLNISIFKI